MKVQRFEGSAAAPDAEVALNNLQGEVNRWSSRNFTIRNPDHPLMGLVEELGELSHAHLKQKQGIRGTFKDHQDAKVDAVADIVIYLCDYCSMNSIDLGTAVADTWERVIKRDWVNHPKDGGES